MQISMIMISKEAQVETGEQITADVDLTCTAILKTPNQKV